MSTKPINSTNAVQIFYRYSAANTRRYLGLNISNKMAVLRQGARVAKLILFLYFMFHAPFGE